MTFGTCGTGCSSPGIEHRLQSFHRAHRYIQALARHPFKSAARGARIAATCVAAGCSHRCNSGCNHLRQDFRSPGVPDDCHSRHAESESAGRGRVLTSTKRADVSHLSAHRACGCEILSRIALCSERAAFGEGAKAVCHWPQTRANMWQPSRRGRVRRDRPTRARSARSYTW